MSALTLGGALADQGRTQTWLAVQIGYHRNTVGKWARGEAVPPADVAAQIHQLLDLPPGTFWATKEAA